jgi:serine/threonine-protein kinase
MSSDKRPELPTIKVVMTGEEQQAPDRPEPSGQTLLAGRYRILRRIGKGGMGEVMAAHDEQIGRDVAIKRMRSANPSERAVARFLREASVQGRLEHPSIVPVHEIGRDADGLPFFVMKKLAGTSLATLLETPAAFSLQRALRAFTDVCLAVELAHTRGIVHRDLKPDNIMLGDFGEVYILDWGVAKVIGEAEEGEFADVGSGSGEHATGAGIAIGTPGYMSPEQVVGEPDIDGRADIYTLGCVLFEILTGEPLHPRGQPGLRSSLKGIDARPSQRAKARDIPPELDELCARACHTERASRIATARELGERVQRYLDGDRDLAMRRKLATEHLETARAAFVGAEAEDQRRTAMREAASALALDPTLAGAAELVGRLMLEPPRETPREVSAQIDADDVLSAKAIARAGLWAVLGGLAFMPLFQWIAPVGSLYPLLFTVMLLLDGIVALLAVRSRRPVPGLVAIANTIIVIALARMFSPILIAPGIGASLAMAMVLTPRFSWLGSAIVISALMIAAVIVPLVLELAGVIDPTMSIEHGRVVFHAPGLGEHEWPIILVGALYSAALIAGASIAAAALRASTRKAYHRLQLQAWQLRQLVPTS